MTFRAYYLFDGYPVAWEEDGYNRWLFTRKDRVIRHRTKGERSVIIHDLPENRAEWDEPETDYLYVVTAEELRRRLSRTPRVDPVLSEDEYEPYNVSGDDLTTLQSEFERYKLEMLKDDVPDFYVGESDSEIKQVPERAHALRGTTLNDWLMALKEVIKSGATRAKSFTSPVTPKGPTFDSKALADIILTDLYPRSYDLRPCHDLWGFPCSAFEHLAVAMLEVIPPNAECVLNVTELVENDRVYCFEDLVLANNVSATA
ncbi:HEPN/Toprim-associated domain-containing protein [Paraburkholderia domus]|uniref:HEPN/Toprim N-terminal domain-containing protein n=1 Tax=Paraburkholderia domus TaxID=2793075 RepID=A0A9N8MLG1_9BURK|nr:HEPN/Toprim-associated domain-containing protein [Paraburkholderia domus]MBK5164802.1 hypothetical protein [Burkholderia sp. R-70211]CAE6872576.1 hypothetical protein R70211_01373 [Paraburkholderia domus]